MVKNGLRKKGSVSLLMVIVLPIVIVFSMMLYRFLLKNQRENEQLKLLQHASELQFTEYHLYLLEEYGILGYFKGNGVEGMYKTLLKANGFQEPKAFEIVESSLAEPVVYEKAVIETAKTIIPFAIIEGMQTFVASKNEADQEAPQEGVPSEEAPFEGEVPEKPKEMETVEEREQVLKALLEHKSESNVDIEEGDWTKNSLYRSQLSLMDQMILKEYYLGIYSSLDKECPRNLDLMGRKERGQFQIHGEIEYLIAGDKSDKANQAKVWREIYLLREATNAMHLVTCPSKQKVLTAFHASLPPPWGSIAAATAFVLWSGAESYVDMQKLMAGESLWPVKTESEWTLDFDSLLTGQWSRRNESVKSDGKWYYFDYLRAILYLENTEKVVLRSMNLVEADLKAKSAMQVGLDQLIYNHSIVAEFEEGVSLKFESSYP